MKLGHGVLMVMLLLSILLNVDADPQRSIVERIKALDKGIRQGLQRQKFDSPSDSLPVGEQQQQIKTQPAADEKSTTTQQQLSPEDTDGTSDVVRQLTASYEQDNDVRILSISLRHWVSITYLYRIKKERNKPREPYGFFPPVFVMRIPRYKKKRRRKK